MFYKYYVFLNNNIVFHRFCELLIDSRTPLLNIKRTNQFQTNRFWMDKSFERFIQERSRLLSSDNIFIF